MATTSLHHFRCPTCGAAFDVQRHDLVNVKNRLTLEPDIKDQVRTGQGISCTVHFTKTGTFL